MSNSQQNIPAGFKLLRSVHIHPIKPENYPFITSIAWSPDGTKLAVSSTDMTIRILDLASGKTIQQFVGHTGAVWTVAWSPNSKIIASGSEDTTIRFWSINKGKEVKKIRTPHPVKSVDWSTKNNVIATLHSSGNIRLWDGIKKNQTRTLMGTSKDVQQIKWFPSDQKLLSISGKIATIWNSQNGIRIYTLRSSENEASIPLDPSFHIINTLPILDGKYPGTDALYDSLEDATQDTSLDTNIRIWDFPSTNAKGIRPTPFINNFGSVAHIYRNSNYHIDIWRRSRFGKSLFKNVFFEATEPDNNILSVTVSLDSTFIASGHQDNIISVWTTTNGQKAHLLEGHKFPVISVSFTFDRRFLASLSLEGTVRLWDCETWTTSALFENSGMCSCLVFHPSEKIFAVVSSENTEVEFWILDYDELRRASSVEEAVHYANAKVVLLGDSGVGKSGLALVLNSQEFQPTESTHGRHVWALKQDTVQESDGRKEIREVLLWDLAGQPGYRLIHQLNLYETTIALVVFDSRSEIDPFAGVSYWNRALSVAKRVDQNQLMLKKILVAARTDRGRIAVSKKRIELKAEELGFAGFYETSAKEYQGIDELREAIIASVDWDSLPKVSSNRLFQSIRDFIADQIKLGLTLSPVENLYQGYLNSPFNLENLMDVSAEFKTVLGRLQVSGTIRSMGFGNLILLKPELVDAYASAIIEEAKSEPDGLGFIKEENIRNGQFAMSADERIGNPDLEHLLLIATTESLIRHEIALREGDGLIFPSQFTRMNPDFPDRPEAAVKFFFTGPTQNIYTRLIVRLSRSEIFHKHDLWKNAALFEVHKARCGIHMQEPEEALAELSIFYQGANKDIRVLFEEYIKVQLERLANPDSLTVERKVICDNCNHVISADAIRKRRERKLNYINCPVCDSRISLEIPNTSAQYEEQISIMDFNATSELNRERAISILEGKMATQDFDVFMAHNHKDKTEVTAIAGELKKRGINPWIDEEQVPPGQWFQDVIQAAIPRVRCAAIFIGPNGLGRWQVLELRTFISQCVENRLPVIPILLPGVNEIPPELPFLRELNFVHFKSGINDRKSMDRFVWGITGVKP